MKIPRNVFAQIVEVLLEGGYKKATKYLSPTLTVKGSLRHKLDRRMRIQEIVFTIGGPNYAERRFIRSLQKVGEPFPVKRLQLRRSH